MSEQGYAIHYVCTHHRAKEMAFGHGKFWVSNCGCRERKGRCERSRMDVCLMFYDTAASGSGKKEITLTDLLAIFEEAENKRLVSRPFRSEKDPNITEGICFCCDDCCGYFLNEGKYACDRGAMVESTRMDKCNFCGDCVPACYFGARKMVDDELHVAHDECFGCGLCADVCPEKCVAMVARI